VHQAPPSLESDDWPKWDFDAHAQHYVGSVDQSVAFTGRTSAFFAQRKCELLNEMASSTVGDLHSLSVLDVGCGTGSTDRYLVDIAGSLTGVDVSQEMLKIAANNVPQATYEWYNGEKLPFPDGAFDVSIAICVLHHVPMSVRAKFVAEMHRVTRHDGLIAIFEHNPYNPLTRHAVNSCDLDAGVVLVRGNEAVAYAQRAGAASVGRSDYLFTPLGGETGRSIDRRLNRLPFGGQYVVSARAQHAS
jgi:SAM-dependent methyltransferase